MRFDHRFVSFSSSPSSLSRSPPHQPATESNPTPPHAHGIKQRSAALSAPNHRSSGALAHLATAPPSLKAEPDPTKSHPAESPLAAPPPPRSSKTLAGMKIQCNACGAAEARVLCCADEAALCAACDEEVHAANKLAGKHQRVPLLSDADADASAPAPAVPKCDICQVSAVPPFL